MKKIKFLSILLTICLCIGALTPAAAAIESVPAVKSTAVYLVDEDSGHVYYEQYSDRKVYPASLTKIMTAMLAIEAVERGEVSLDDPVTALPGYDFDMEEDGSTSGILEGETMRLEELLYCTLMASANEACNIVAMYICGSVDAFVARMNERAQELGCTDTHFANTHGLPNEQHYTTAHDMSLIARQAMTYDTFVTICDTAEHTVPATNLSTARALTNTNGLISGESIYKGYLYEPAVGIKTGHTNAAGYCLISSAEKDGIRLLCVVMGGVMTEAVNGNNDYSNFSDTIALYNWVFGNYSRQEIVSADTPVYEIPVKLGSDADSVALRAQTAVSAVLPNDADLTKIEKKITIYGEDGSCEAPISEGQVLGEMTILLDGVEYGTTYLAANRSVDLSYFQSMGAAVRRTLDNTWVRVILAVIVLIFVGYAVLAIRYRILYRRRQKEKQEARLQRQRMQEQAERERMMAEARRRSYRSEHPDSAPPPSDVTRDYFEEFFK